MGSARRPRGQRILRSSRAEDTTAVRTVVWSSVDLDTGGSHALLDSAVGDSGTFRGVAPDPGSASTLVSACQEAGMTLTAVSCCTRTNSPRPGSWARASGLLVDEWLLERRPPADLAGQLACAWRGDFGEARTLLPDECVDMYWVGGSVWVSGPETRSWPSSAWPSTGAVGVCFRSGVASSLLGVAASELRDVRVGIDQLWGDRAARELAGRVSCRDDD